MVQQRLEQPPGQAELPLRRLIGIGGGADDQRGVTEFPGLEGPEQDVGRAVLDQDVLLEGEVGRLAGRARRVALQSPLVGAAGVAVGAAELAPDIGIERPESHWVAGGGLSTRRTGSARNRVPAAPDPGPAAPGAQTIE